MRRTGPLRQVVFRRRVGEWGKTSWLHLLECGHSESRPRRGNSWLRCAACRDAPTPVDPESVEVRRVLVRAELAHRFGVDPEAVEVLVSPAGDISGARVWLSASYLTEYGA